MQLITRWTTPVFIVVLGVAMAAAAQGLLIHDNEHDVQGGVLLLGRGGDDCCDGHTCHGNFVLENAGDRVFGRVAFGVGALVGVGAEIPAGALSFSPASLPQFKPHQTRTITLKVSVPAGLPNGRYRGLLSALEIDGEAGVELPVEVVLCADEPPEPSLRLVPGQGTFDGEAVRFADRSTGCESTRQQASFVVEADGNVPLAAVRPDLLDLPRGATVRFQPSSVSLGPGERASFLATLELPEELEPGDYGATLSVRDPAGAAEARSAASFRFCVPGVEEKPSLKLVAGQGSFDGTLLSFTDRGQGCASLRREASFVVEADGNVALSSVRPDLLGLPAGVSVSVQPASVNLKPGQRASFKASLLLPKHQRPGNYGLSLVVRDPGASAEASAAAHFAFCEADVPQDRLALRLVTGQGSFDGKLLSFADGEQSCASLRQEASFVVEAVGQGPRLAVTPDLQGLPVGASVSFEPASAELQPGSRASFLVSLTLPRDQRPGSYGMTLVVRDPAGTAETGAAAHFAYCEESEDEEDDPLDDGPTVAGDGPDGFETTGDDWGRASLELTQHASRSGARIGQVVSLVATVRNTGTSVLRDLSLQERLPPGFVYAQGRTAIDGEAAADPRGRVALSWSLPALRPGEQTTLAFQFVVSSSSALGSNGIAAEARADRAEPASVVTTIEVTRTSLRQLGAVRGAVRYSDGRGVGRVRLLLDSDRETFTADDGGFRFDGVLGGEHLITVDERSLPAESRLTSDESRFVHLFPSSTETVEFGVIGRPWLHLKLERLDGPVEARTHGRE